MIWKSTRDAYGACLTEIGTNERIVVLDADLSSSTKTSKFAEKYPERFFNVGVAEQNLLATAAGLAYAGKIAIASTYAIFATGRAWEQIRIIAHDNLNVKVIVTHAGLTNGPDGASHHSLEDIALMRAIPNMKVIVPADAVETDQVVRAAVKFPGPCYIRLSRVESPVIFNSDYKFELGKGVILKDGQDLTLVATGNMVSKTLEAAGILEKEGEVSARVINLSTIKPTDKDILTVAAKETGAIVTVEEHSVCGGLGSTVAEAVIAAQPVPMEFVGVMDMFTQTGETEELYELYGLNPKNIVKVSRRVLSRKKR